MALRHTTIQSTPNSARGADQASPNAPAPDELAARFAAIRAQFDVSVDFSDEVVAAAESAVAEAQLPERDETAVPFFTIDPVGSMDLDQAMHLERHGDGYRIRYAIADVPAFVSPGGVLDQETRRRGQTIYCPDVRALLHPSIVSEGGASLLAGQVRPAYVWDMKLDHDGNLVDTDIYLARVKSVARLDYDSVQQQIDDGTADEQLLLLQEIGEKRIELEEERGGASLPMPEQEVSRTDNGYELHFRPPQPAQDWNAQISLLTGMAAAELMLHAQVGVLRTMPPADPEALKRFHRQAKALGIDWPLDLPYGRFLRTLDRDNPKHLALIYEATSLFRGAGYTAFDGDLPELPEHAAVAAPYAHVTAPLRRLVDRFGLAVCASIAADQPMPSWVRASLPELPELMAASDQRARGVERASTDAVEAAALSGHVGETFAAVVVAADEKGVTVQILEPPTVGHASGHAKLGDEVQVILKDAQIAGSQVAFVLADAPSAAAH